MHRGVVGILILILLGALPQDRLHAQTDTAQVAQSIDVFLDCQTFRCDFDHFRREIAFVNWVRDRQDSDVHVLGTAEGTGGGGRLHTLAFIGLRRYAGTIDTLRYITSNTDTDAETRDGLVQTVKLGLVRFVAPTPVGSRLSISYDAPTEGEQAIQPDDPWNLWVFQIRAGGNASGESEQRSYFWRGSLSADRTAEDFRLNLNFSGNRFENQTDVPELDTTFVNSQTRINLRGEAVWSIGEHWAVGSQVRVFKSTFTNHKLGFEGGPAIEYNIYPYSESTRRQITLFYTIGVSAFDYDEITILGETAQVLPTHQFELAAEFQQPWGEIDGSIELSQFLHDPSLHRIDVFGGFEIRIIRGFNVNLFGGVSRVKDQIFLSGADLTPEERLLGIRQFGTNFFFFASFGFSYRFGSKFANIVNPRMN